MSGTNTNGVGWKLATGLGAVLLSFGGIWIGAVSAEVAENSKTLAAHRSIVQAAAVLGEKNGERIGKIERSVTGIERDVAHNREKLERIDEKLDRLLERQPNR